MNEKYKILIDILKELKSVCCGFSGGVDSALLLYAAKEALGDKVVAVTATSSLIPKEDIKEAKDFCKSLNIKHILLNIDISDINGFSKNPPNRCYICKKHIFSEINNIKNNLGFNFVIEGSNADDEKDYRPGMKAIKELNIKSPLNKAGLTKNEIRNLANKFNIPLWNKPSAACLASRFAYGDIITKENLEKVYLAEKKLSSLNIKGFRVRLHKNIARIEVNEKDFDIIIKNRADIYDYMTNLGFKYVTLDLKGYRIGSMNEELQNVKL
ncbi:MAG: ATP-dependent sacrificial sulfur transferase LarE [Lachnospirales bacterium]